MCRVLNYYFKQLFFCLVFRKPELGAWHSKAIQLKQIRLLKYSGYVAGLCCHDIPTKEKTKQTTTKNTMRGKRLIIMKQEKLYLSKATMNILHILISSETHFG